MPSIFVWKADTANPSKKTIRCYSGSNWILEDNDYSSHSYKYLQQIVIPGSNNDTVITFLVKSMPSDWIGSELLEITHVPYHVIRSDEYGTLEHIGHWMRFTTRQEIDFQAENLQKEFMNIQRWMSTPSRDVVTPNRSTSRTREHRPPLRKGHAPRASPPVPSIPSISLTSSISPQQIQQDFQEFYQKFVTRTPHVTHPSHPRSHPRSHH